MVELTKDIEHLHKHIADAHKSLEKAMAISDAIGIGFSWDLAYGMGGYYHPNYMSLEEALEIVQTGRYEKLSEQQKNRVIEVLRRKVENPNYEKNGDGPGWHSSSSNC